MNSASSEDENFFITPDTLNVKNRINIEYDRFNVLLMNARSLSPKISWLLNSFEAFNLDFALVTESWLKGGEVLDRDVVDLEYGTGLKIFYKNRPKKAASQRRVGGGVSIIFRKSPCKL